MAQPAPSPPSFLEADTLLVLHDTTLDIVGRLDLTELLEAIVERSLGLVQSLYGWVYLVAEGGETIQVKVATGLFRQYIGLSLRKGEGLAGAVWQHGRPLSVDDYHTWAQRSSYFEGDRIGPAMGVPLKAGADVVGVIGLTRPPGGPAFTAGELELMSRFAQLASIALENARLHTSLQRDYETLERRVRERTYELAALNAIAGAVSHSLDLESILYDALDKTLEVMGMELGLACRLATAAEAGGPEPGDWSRLIPLAHRGMWEAISTAAAPSPPAWPHLALPLGTRPVVEEVAGQRPSPYRDALLRQGVGLFISVPLISKATLLGAIFLASSRVRSVTDDELSLLQAVGAQVAVAMENAHLYQDALHRQAETERRRQVAEGMREILASLNSNQPLGEILNDLVARASQLLGTDAGVIRRIEAGRGLAVREAGYQMPPELDHERILPLAPTAGNAAVADRRPVVIPDYLAYAGQQMAGLDPVTREQYGALAGGFATHFRSAIRVPLVARDRLYGELALFCQAPRDFSAEDLGVALAIADQTALAIENALLRQQAAEAASITERARLARELHDSVTQSLYSMTLYAEAAARLLTSSETVKAAEYLRDLRDTSQEALREMRLLVFELRPPALEQVGLAGALGARLKAVEARGGMATEFQLEGEAPPSWLSLGDQQELYTIAQEALNNAFKHAHAQRVGVCLQYGEQSVSVIVRDDGGGFDPHMAQASGGMGLAGMAERAGRIGARLLIDSSLGHGTTVSVNIRQHRLDQTDGSQK